jgi:nucleoside-diphosphate-sugar epimerase
VFHLATHYLKSHTGADVAPLIQANVVFGAELIDALLPGTVVISTMSYFQFENGEERPHSLYAATKQAFSEIASYYRDRKELDVREVILFDTFGPRDTREKLIPRIVASIDRGEPMSMGNSSQPIDLLFVDDVVEGLIAASRGHAFERTALRSRRTLTVAEIVAAFEQVSGRELTKAYDDSVPPNDLVDRVGRWPAPPGWVPATELEEGAALTWEARGSY